MAASTLCILSVVSRHIMYLIKYCSNKCIFLIIIIIIRFIHHFLRNVLNQECLYHSAT